MNSNMSKLVLLSMVSLTTLIAMLSLATAQTMGIPELQQTDSFGNPTTNPQTNPQTNQTGNTPTNLQPNTQPTPGANQQTSCVARFDASLTPTCFEASGINFTGVVYLLSNNRSGAIPAGYTYASFVQFLCTTQMQDTVIPCVLAQVQKHNTTQCSANDRAVLLGRSSQLLTFLENICGQPCEQESTQSLIQCYAAINMNPEPILGQNASIIQDMYSIIGKNDTEFDNFCKNRQKLFSCLGPLSATCPGLLQKLYTIGIDLQALETVAGMVCADRQKYVQGLTCVSSGSQDLAQCSQTTISNMQAVMLGRFQSGTIPPSKYMDNLCKVKLAQMSCELATYGKTCDADSSALRTNVECGLLPKPCREGSQFQADYSAICQKVTTPAPSQTVRPTPGKPGPVPVDGGSTAVAGVQTGKSAAGSLTASRVAPLLLLFVGLIFSRN